MNIGIIGLGLMGGSFAKDIKNIDKQFIIYGADKSDEQKIERAFISILSRYPSADEKKIFLEEYELNGSAATNNMVSALISTGEFMFVQ